MRIARRRAGARRSPDLKLGICGEHGGDPSSVEFCHELGLDYVSCSPYRLPIARLAAAQAALKERRGARRGEERGAAPRRRSRREAARGGGEERQAREGRAERQDRAAAAAAGIGAALAGKASPRRRGAPRRRRCGARADTPGARGSRQVPVAVAHPTRGRAVLGRGAYFDAPRGFGHTRSRLAAPLPPDPRSDAPPRPLLARARERARCSPASSIAARRRTFAATASGWR